MSSALNTNVELPADGSSRSSRTRDQLQLWEWTQVVPNWHEGVQKEASWRILEYSNLGWKFMAGKVQEWAIEQVSGRPQQVAHEHLQNITAHKGKAVLFREAQWKPAWEDET